ncbi:hypothetical protein [Rothia dentocariosa]|uniref:hypothetical protein n=1 Tax=Rothia dentocariosa TaxID=2047 RepID=UPI0028E58EED|nr:hypothetical protein [Rothia dentocariosa]
MTEHDELDDLEREQIRDRLKQERMIKSAFANGDGPWTIVYDDWRFDNDADGGRYMAFAQPQMHTKILSHGGWDFSKGDGFPGFVTNGEETRYAKGDKLPEFEPLVIYQHYYGVVPDELHISEEFRLLMNLWQDPKSGDYFEIKDDGSKDPAIRFQDKRIEVRTPLLKRYMAARQLDAVLFIDTRTSAEYDGDVAVFSDLDFEGRIGNELMYLSRSVGRSPLSDARVGSLVFAKRILPAPPQETCGIWPWDEDDPADYPEFIIGEDEYGKPVKYTCDPDCLANYFGKNPDAPHYLTPVFFKPEVLQRYYDDSDLYTVSDGQLSCASMWGVKIDNGNPNCVVVFLGDIGRDIPAGHRTHWLSYNVSPTQRMSDVGVRRAFFGQFADSENPEHRFKLAYNQLQNSWEEHWGWRLHRKAEGQDAGVLQRLRIPVNDTDAELRAQLINLALVLVDYLNEKQVASYLSDAKGDKGIAKLKKFLTAQSYRHTERDVRLLQRIQGMRSRIAAHSSGSSGQAYLEEELGNDTPQEYIARLMTEATQMLDDLRVFAEEQSRQDSDS